MKEKIYMAVTRDELSLPLAVAGNKYELARMLGISPGSVSKYISRDKKSEYPGYIKVEVGDDDATLL